MKFTVVSHACLYVEHEDIRLVIDPWFIGSCYWRSWWNYPEVSEELIDTIKPTHIYLTHLHWDHYHGPTLRKLESFNPTVLLPKHLNKRMKNDLLRDFNFSNIKELDHGKKHKLREYFQLTSYQFNPVIIDSSLVIESDGVTLLNSNDSKTFGLSLRHIINNHPNIDFAFRSHSSATPIPQCVRNMNVEETNRRPLDYADDFIAFAKATRCKYIVPFASSHIYLHDLSKKFNKYYSDPLFVKRQFDLKINSGQKCKIMVSGSSWSKKNGFNIKNHDFANLNSDIALYTLKNKEKIEKQIKLGEQKKLNIKAFENYYHRFLNACNSPYKLLNFRFGFLINENKSSTKFLCIIDGIKNKTEVIKITSEEEFYKNKLAFIIKTPLNIFNDCNKKLMHNTFTPSKLLEIITTKKNSLKLVSKYFNLIDLYENDSLPIYKILSLRNIIIVLRRWRELFDIVYYIFIIKIQKKKMYNLWNKI